LARTALDQTSSPIVDFGREVSTEKPKGIFYCFPIGGVASSTRYGHPIEAKGGTGDNDGWESGCLARDAGAYGAETLDTLGPLHGYGIARRIEQTSGDVRAVNYGSLYPALLKLEQEGYIRSEWGASDNNRRAKYYKLTRAGRKQLDREAHEWEQAIAILARFWVRSEGQS
jgi:transcriptional regulator